MKTKLTHSTERIVTNPPQLSNLNSKRRQRSGGCGCNTHVEIWGTTRFVPINYNMTTSEHSARWARNPKARGKLINTKRLSTLLWSQSAPNVFFWKFSLFTLENKIFFRKENIFRYHAAPKPYKRHDTIPKKETTSSSQGLLGVQDLIFFSRM